jgi:hypothetical protein
MHIYNYSLNGCFVAHKCYRPAIRTVIKVEKLLEIFNNFSPHPTSIAQQPLGGQGLPVVEASR